MKNEWKIINMKKIISLVATLLTLSLLPVFGQQPSPVYQPPPPVIGPRFRTPVSAAAPSGKSDLATFDLNFAGGSPAQLVEMIEKASGRPLNVIINKEDENTELPPLKMNGVNVAQLFDALEAASTKLVAVSTGAWSYNRVTTSYGFKTTGQPTESSIWYFYVERPNLPPVVSTEKVCRFYSLALYLDRGFTVDDITTAIQSGWKMAGATLPSQLPELKYHKETKMLIAYGDPHQLSTIEQVLQTLPSSNATRSELDEMHNTIKNLNVEVNKLNNTIAARNSATGEKSGK
jgi:hypothetical protein